MTTTDVLILSAWIGAAVFFLCRHTTWLADEIIKEVKRARKAEDVIGTIVDFRQSGHEMHVCQACDYSQCVDCDGDRCVKCGAIFEPDGE